MGIVLNRVSHDTSAPPALYGATGVEPPVPAAAHWNEHVDVAIVGGGVTGLWSAYHLAVKGARVAVLEAHQIGNGASGRRRRGAGGDCGLHREISDRLRGNANRHPVRRADPRWRGSP
jgi:choline dehydrogenase-like flavoprotein